MKNQFYLFLWISIFLLLTACGDDKQEPDVIAVTGVELNRIELTLEEGDSEILVATVMPEDATNKKVTWKSSDASVASVDANGKVTALQTGMAIVLVITEDGGKVAVCTVTCGGEIERPEVPVTGVELNKDKCSLVEGENETLKAIVLPENATNKELVWSSSDESIAVVDASGKVTALRAGTATVIVLTADGAKSASCEVTVESALPREGSRTVLVYVAADNSLSSFASADLAEMKAGIAKVKDDADAHLLVYIDDGQSARLLELKNAGGTVMETEVRNYGQRNSVGVSETKEVFAEVFQNSRYRADSYGLVYWSHGEGWLPYPSYVGTRWIGQDKGSGTDHRMNISEFAEILSTAPHFDFILFDACFMQSIEVAYELRSYTDYFIGSPTEIPGPGAPYDEVVPAMFAADNAAVGIATAYYAPYAILYNPNVDVSNWNWTGGVSVSVLRNDCLEQLAQATKQAMSESADNAWLRSVVFDYDKRRSSSSSHVGYYDFAGMMGQVATDATYDEWKKAFADAVVYWTTTAENYSSYVGRFSMESTTGMSCYIPTASNTSTDRAYRSTGWYESAGFR